MTPISDILLEIAEMWCVLEPRAVKFVASIPGAAFEQLREELRILSLMVGVPESEILMTATEITLHDNVEIRVTSGVSTLSVTACDENWSPIHWP